MAIMGFGGGAFIASPLSVWADGHLQDFKLRRRGADVHHHGRDLLRLHGGRRDHRAGAGGGLEAGRPTRRHRSRRKLITRNDVFVYDALKTPQFWLIWWILCLNVTAGIGVIGQASAMSQEMFPGKVTAIAAAGFVGLMSLFNMGGRFFWASTSDYIGRKNTYFVFMVLGFALYCTVPYTGAVGSVAGFVLLLPGDHQHVWRRLSPPCLPISGTCSARAMSRHPRLADHGLVYGRIFGPVLVNYIRQYNVTHGVPKAQAYNVTMYIMADCW